jgi:hypothetical protein
MATICSNETTFKVKKVENTNKMFILDVSSTNDKGSNILT